MNTKEHMIEKQLIDKGIQNPSVLEAMYLVDRALFVPSNLRHKAYEDSPLPIGEGQTISQPYIVAYMAELLDIQPNDKILEVGTGCGYNAAVMAHLAKEVYSIEIIDWLANLAKKNLDKAGIENVHARLGDGYKGWPSQAPFNKIVITAATPSFPDPLKEQLAIGGRLLGPLTNSFQKLILLYKEDEQHFIEEDLIHVRFVPMTGQIQSNL